jgi:3-methyladenine DNA glycosylase AlkD
MSAVVDSLVEVYGQAGDPARAAAMAAYMRDQFPFLGIAAPARRDLSRRVLAGLPPPEEAALIAEAQACWALPQREYQYFACDRLRRHAKLLSIGALPAIRDLIVTKPWWDTVDLLAADVVGVLVERHPELVSTMDEWAAGDELWLIRTAILHQLRYGRRTDSERLLRYCAARASHTDFFIRKAIGWALRQYAKTDPDTVRHFVQAHATLSGLSVREALKNLG